MGEAQDAFIIFDEAYEGNDVDAFYLGDILRALGAILTAVKADTSSTGVKEDYIEGLKVFDKDDILRALGCNVTNAAVASHGGTEALGEKRIAFADFGAILTAVKADTSSTGVKEDYIEGLKVFDKDGTGKVPLP